MSLVLWFAYYVSWQGFLGFIVFSFFFLFLNIRFMSFSKFGKISDILRIHFSVWPSYSSPSGSLMTYVLDFFVCLFVMGTHRSWGSVHIFPNLFSLCCSDWVISLCYILKLMDSLLCPLYSLAEFTQWVILVHKLQFWNFYLVHLYIFYSFVETFLFICLKFL